MDDADSSWSEKTVKTRTKEEERKDRSAAWNSVSSDLHKMLSKVAKMNKTLAKAENSPTRCKF